MNDDIDTVGKMITKAVARVARRETRREAVRHARQLRKDAERMLLDVLETSGLTTAVMDFLDAKDKAHEKELSNSIPVSWNDDDPRSDEIDAAYQAIEDKYFDVQSELEYQLTEHFAQFWTPSLDEIVEEIRERRPKGKPSTRSVQLSKPMASNSPTTTSPA